MAMISDTHGGVGVEMVTAVQLLFQCVCMQPSACVVSMEDRPPIVFLGTEDCGIDMVLRFKLRLAAFVRVVPDGAGVVVTIAV